MSQELFDTELPNDDKCSRVVTVAFDSGADTVFDYLLPDKLLSVEPGQRLEVPFGRANKITKCFCIDCRLASDEKPQKGHKFKLKKVKAVIDDTPLIDSQLMGLAKWIHDYYVAPLGQVLNAMVPSAVKKGTGTKTEKYYYLAIDFKQLEETAKQLRGKKQKQLVEFLASENAFTSEKSISAGLLSEKIGVSAATFKGLAHKGLIKSISQTVYRALPILPEGLVLKTKEVVLNDDQKKALAEINSEIDAGSFAVALLHGITDSGKTEVYIRAIENALSRGRGAIVLLPEIALTAQTVQRFSSRFKEIAVVHSRLTAAQRNAEWQKICSGQAKVVVGARSAIFAPVENLGLVVVDEEHEPSYKQDTVPRYNGRDVAIKRTQLAEAVCVLGSATPCLESLYNCKTKKYFTRLALPKRVMDLPKPIMNIVDMTAEKFGSNGALISAQLESAVKQALSKGEQAILLLNRRGYSNFIFCPSCRHTLKCRNCDVALTFHKSERLGRKKAIDGRIAGGYAMCHYCLAQTLVPKKCPLCGKNVVMIGLGSQRLIDEVEKKFPDANSVRVDSDSMQKQNYYELLKDFDSGKINILAGTQILAKGLHFPNVTVVGVISADTSLELPDFRANERTYSLICQVAGRAGRSQKGGKVFIQTFSPDSKVIRYAAADNFAGFITDELQHRRACELPPFGRVALVRMRDANEEKLMAACDVMASRIRGIIENYNLDVKVTGPLPSSIARMHRQYRMQIIVQSKSVSHIGKLFSVMRNMPSVKPAVTTQIDVDPINLL